VEQDIDANDLIPQWDDLSWLTMNSACFLSMAEANASSDATMPGQLPVAIRQRYRRLPPRSRSLPLLIHEHFSPSIAQCLF